MKTDYTHISFVLDRSGSMQSLRTDTIGGFNRFLEDQQTVPGKATMTLVQFDTMGIDTMQNATDIKSVPKLSMETYVPRDGTPLYDAIGKTIEETGAFLKNTSESDRPAKVVFVVMTDGMENASTKFDLKRVREMIEHQKTAYKWEFVFMGANIDSYAVGGSVGVAGANTMNFAANSSGVKFAYAGTSSNLRKFRTGAVRSMAFTKEDYDAQSKAGQEQ